MSFRVLASGKLPSRSPLRPRRGEAVSDVLRARGLLASLLSTALPSSSLHMGIRGECALNHFKGVLRPSVKIVEKRGESGSF